MRKTVLDFISKLLFDSVKAYEIKELIKDDDFINNLIKIASSHLILPLVHSKLKKNDLLYLFPNNFVGFLNEISILNRSRNEHLLIELNQLNQLLKQNDVDYVFLKGTALLADCYFEAISDRMVGDIDILVSKKDFKRVIKILKDDGYSSKNNHQFFNKIHFPRLIHKERVFCVEIHEELIRHGQIKLFPPEKVLKNKKKMKNNVPIPNELNLFLHAIYNFQINDHGSLYAIYSFRNLYDVFTIKQKNKINLDQIPENDIVNKYFIIAGNYSKAFIISPQNFRLCLYKQRYLFKTNFKIIWEIDFFIMKYFRILFLKKPRQFYVFITDKKYRVYLLNKYNF